MTTASVMEMECDDVKLDVSDSSTPASPISSTAVSSSASITAVPSRPSTRSSLTQKPESAANQTPTGGRTTRLSQNPDFAAKHRKFLNRVHDAISKSDECVTDDSSSGGSSPVIENRDKGLSSDDSMSSNAATSRTRLSEKRRRESVSSLKHSNNNDTDSEEQSIESDSTIADSPKKKKLVKAESPCLSKLQPLDGCDRYCWRCHRDGNVITCKTCPRVYHLRCTQLESAPQSDWVCPECTAIVYAETLNTRSVAMKSLSLDQLCNLLKYTLTRMKSYAGSEWFCKPVDQTEFPEYCNFVVHPMDLTLLEKNIKQKRYGSTEAFLAETKWVLHNCIVFNTYQSKLTNIAKMLLKICKQEMAEIENCPDCYLNAHTRKDSWFIEVCRRPHIIVWAKLKGFPFWPAKAMRTNSENHVDVRFFGAHDRAWVPVNCVYLYNRNPPTGASKNKKKNNLDECIAEVEQHIKKLRDRFGKFEYAPFKALYDPENEDQQLRIMLPAYSGPSRPNKRSLLGSTRNSQPFEHADDKQIKKEEAVDSSKKVAVNVNKKLLKVARSVDNEKTTATGRSETNSDSALSLDLKNENACKSENADLNTLPPVAESNIVFRGLAVKRHLSAVYDGGGDGDSNSNDDTNRSNETSGVDKELSALSVKQRRRDSDNSVSISVINGSNNSDCSNNTSSNSNNNNNEISLLSNKTELTITRKGLATSVRTVQKPDSDEHTFFKEQLQNNVLSVKNLPNVSLTSADNSNNESSERLSSVISSVVDCTADKSITTNALSKDDSSKLVKDTCTDKDNICDNSFKNSNNDSSSSSQITVDKQPVVLLHDIKNINIATKGIDIKEEVLSDDEKESSKEVNANADQIAKELFLEKHNLTLTSKCKTNVNDKDDKSTEAGCVDQTVANQNDTTSSSSTSAAVVGVKVYRNKSSAVNRRNSLTSVLESVSSKINANISEVKGASSTTDNNSSQEANVDVLSDKASCTISLKDRSPDSSESETSLSSLTSKSLHQQILKSVSDNGDKSSTNIINRRKSKPVKIRSRSNTSSSEDTVEELKRICEEQETYHRISEKPQTIEEVLDEVSGRFRRKDRSNSDDPNVTITLVSDDEQVKQTPPPKSIKEHHGTVSLSRDVSLSIVPTNNLEECSKDLSTSLDMECVESDTDEPVSVNDSNRFKPTARKTFPNPTSNKTNSVKFSGKSLLSNKKDIQIMPIVDHMKNNKVLPTRPLVKAPGSDEVKISNTMSMKLQPTTVSSPVVNGNLSSPPAVLPAGSSAAVTTSSTTNFSRNSTTTQARVLPQMQPKPVNGIPPDAQLSGQTSSQLDNCSQKLAQRFRSMLEDMLRDLSSEGSPEAAVKAMQLEIEKLQWKHRQELCELKHNTDLVIMEMRASLEAEKQRLVLETKMKCLADKEAAINETKMKQWCALCRKEAMFYCCWNTSYCNYPCQQAHWPQHVDVCGQSASSPSDMVVSKTTTLATKLKPTSNSGKNKHVSYNNPATSQHLKTPCMGSLSQPHLLTQQADMKLMPPPLSPLMPPTSPLMPPPTSPLMPPPMSPLMPPMPGSYGRMMNGAKHHPSNSLPPMHGLTMPPPPMPMSSSSSQCMLNSGYRPGGLSVRPAQYFMVPRGTQAAKNYYHH